MASVVTRGEEDSSADGETEASSDIRGSQIPIFETDPEGKFLFVPLELEELTGFNRSELSLLSLQNVTFFEDHDRLVSALRSIGEGAPLAITDITIFTESGGSHPVELIMAPGIDHLGNRKVMGAFRDNRGRKELDNHIEVTRETQEASKRFLEDFVSFLAREIRQPLTTVMLTLELLDSGSYGDLNEVQTEKVSQLLHIIDMLKVTLNETLDMSRYIDEGVVLDREAVKFEDLVREVLDGSSRDISSRNLIIEADYTGEGSDAEVDRKAMIQVISTLVTRAISHSPVDGHIMIELTREDDGILFSISDSGSGIPEERIGGLFDMDRLGSDLEGGDITENLGLHVAKRLVNRHGGRIWCESFVGLGSTFFMKIPVLRAGEVSSR